MILHHIGDAHEWHFATLGDQKEHGVHFTIPLPIIAFQPGKGLFSPLTSGISAPNGLKLEHEHLIAEDGGKVYDFSITKNVASLFLKKLPTRKPSVPAR